MSCICKTLIHLTRLPGPWCCQEQDRCLTTSQLKEVLELTVCRANLGEVCVTNGNPFSGLSQMPHNHWLPAVKHDEDSYDSPYVLLSTPPPPHQGPQQLRHSRMQDTHHYKLAELLRLQISLTSPQHCPLVH